MNTANQISNQEQAGDVYESISSDQTDKVEPKLDQKVSDCQYYLSQNICFPNQPPHFERLMQIYKQNQRKLKQLANEVHQLEALKLKKLRLSKNKKTQQDFAFHEIVNSDAQKIDYYKDKRAAREKQLKQLKQLYMKLNQINQKQAYLLNEDHFNKAMTIIDKHKRVISYKIANHNLIVLTQHIQKCKQKDSSLIQMKLNQSTILIQNQDQEFYTVAVFKLSNLLHWMRIKNVDFQLQQKKKIEDLIACKQQAEKDVINVKSVNIISAQKFQSATYSQTFQLIFIQNEATILVYNITGELKQKLIFDKVQEILRYELIKDKLLVITVQGVIRQYHLSKDSEVELVQLTKCTFTADKLNRVLLSQKEQEINVLYTISNTLFSFDLRSFEIKQRGILQQTKINNLSPVLASYFSKYISFLTDDQIQKVDRVLKEKVKQKELALLQIYKEITAQERPELRLILGDGKGGLTILNL